MSFEFFLENVSDPTGHMSAVDFYEISDLSPEELGQFASAWYLLSIERQREIATTLVELAEDNPELDFTAIYTLCLKGDDEPLLQIVMDGLWEHDDRSVISGLVEVLRSDKGSDVRSAAASALGRFPLLAQEGKLLVRDGELIHDNLMQVLEDEEEPMEVRRRCMEALAPFNTMEINQHITLAYESLDLDFRASSIFAMGRTGEVGWLPILLQELQNEEPTIRYETANACGELGEEDAVSHLILLLEDSDSEVQLASIGALGKIGGPLAKKVLTSLVKDGDANLEEAALTELQDLEFDEDPQGYLGDL
ncbi:MAG: HEAT repeat domain-containing protein [Dehalococcoidia bacterium]|jgi:HEAT repeat protein|nr:HEAT repeat domain-containing protein [Dehalococcoidia bacterium]|tara:strand:+ start:2002 stop:2925 length:924 start_codon:yes stop_codon:yes gene_type:complete